MTIEILAGHVSPETAYVVDDYPFGFRLRCKIRYWLEVHKTHGVRFISQTTNPKKGNLVWNKPKASTYSRFAAAMYLDENGHVKHDGLHEYIAHEKVPGWIATFGDGVPEASVALMNHWAKRVTEFDRQLAAGEIKITVTSRQIA